MKRFWIILMAVAVAMALVIALPAGAGDVNCDDPDSKPYTPDHPSCATTTTTEIPATTTTIPDFAECSFDAVTGVLDSWHGQADDERQCIWYVDDPGDTFRFEIQSPDDSVTKVKLPVLIVNDDIVFPSDKCFHDSSGKGFQELDYPADSSWEITPTSAGCGEGPYLLTISIQALRSGTVNLVMTQKTPTTD
ncbi:MAG: hypothetical protein U9R51_06630 [Actinomycetota bacterium]|nr:hypothetical protein [Actinomycetota bacterium]